MAFSFFSFRLNRYIFSLDRTMTSSVKQNYLEARIRDGYSSEDVRMWQALCEQAKTEVGPSVGHLWTIIDIAKNTHCDVLDVVKMGREVSEQKNINEKFMRAIFLAVASDEDDDDVDAPKVIDLTAHEELSDSGSYDDAEPARLTSAACYDIDDDLGSDSQRAAQSSGVKRKLTLESPIDEHGEF